MAKHRTSTSRTARKAALGALAAFGLSGSLVLGHATSTTAMVQLTNTVIGIGGKVVCASMGGNVNVAIGESMTGIAAVISESDPPTVKSVGLGNVDGITLAVGGGQGDATATKDGKTYKITGNAFGIDMANPMQPAKKPFELEFTCP